MEFYVRDCYLLSAPSLTAIFVISEYIIVFSWCQHYWNSVNNIIIKWAASSEFVSSSIPSWQILTAHAQPFRGAGDLAFCLNVPLDSLLAWASSGGSGETARMRMLAWTFAARIGDKYQIRLTRPKWLWCWLVLVINKLLKWSMTHNCCDIGFGLVDNSNKLWHSVTLSLLLAKTFGIFAKTISD